jgi:hypothetical protein
MKRMTAGVALGVVLMTTAACGGSEPAGGATTSGTSPLAEYLGGGGDLGGGGAGGLAMSSGSGGDTEQQQQVQELVVACMKAAGFEYLPYVPDVPDQQPVVEGDPDWAATYGYGITTIDAIGPDSSADPNTAITDAMSEAELAAYHEALFGSGGGMLATGPGGQVVAAAPVAGTGPGPADGASSPPPTDGAAASPGCFQQASAQVYGEPEPVDMQEFSPLFEALSKLQSAVEDDPRMVPLVTGWSDCMADAGHPGFSKVEDARNSIMSQWAALNGWDFTPTEGGGGSVTVEKADQDKELDPAKVAELRAAEIAVAVTDLGCRVNYQSAYEQVRTELEQQFVTEHKAELERYRDATSGGN